MNGIIVINKKEGFTSFDVVAIMRGLLKTKKVGHMGTLDPMATGVLPILIGNATKLQSIIPDADKEYIVGFKLGIATDTQDITGEILKRTDKTVTKAELKEAMRHFRGEIKQVPPMYSAVKKDGVRLYKLARQGVQIEREARKVFIKELSLLGFDEETQTGTMNATCSKGTYMRTLCSDIGEKIGCGATMISLKRTAACGFKIEDSISIDEVKEFATREKIKEKVLSMDEPLKIYDKTEVTKSQAKRFNNGGGLALHRISIKNDICDKTILRVYDNEKKFLGLGIVNEEKMELSIFKLLRED